jgi:hypothetical protein
VATSKDDTQRPVIRGAQHCPVCGLPPERDDARLSRMGVGQATFLCAQYHLWSVRWVVAA